MAKFVKDTEINVLLEEIIKEAQEQIILFCPFFKLHDRLRDSLKLRINDHNLRIIIVFGKNEEDPSKSLHNDDYEFLKSFPFVEIAYERRLHAKFYTNEKRGIITSLNLYSHSHNNNIEVGVMFQSKNFIKHIADMTLGSLTSMISDTEDLSTEANKFFVNVYKNADKIFQKEPKFSSNIIGLNKKYTHSDILTDRTEWFKEQINPYLGKKEKRQIGFNVAPSIRYDQAFQQGFCIRTKEKIAFNPTKPLSRHAYQIWSEYNNPDFKEKYCHACGQAFTSSMRNPLCYKCSN